MITTGEIGVRLLREGDAAWISDAFFRAGDASKPASLYLRYCVEQRATIRWCWVAFSGAEVAGYVTLHLQPLYPGIAGKGIPEIQDLNVLPAYRRRGVATRLLDHAESHAARHAATVAIGVGLHPGYNAAQRLYGLRGYVPDGLGVTHDDRYVRAGETVPLDDELVLHLTKPVRS
jgi:GNAT superfamily N-acetyltransferase